MALQPLFIRGWKQLSAYCELLNFELYYDLILIGYGNK